MANRWSWLENLLSRPVGVIVVFALGVMFLAAIETAGALFSPGKAGAFVSVVSVFGLFGVFLGAIYATEVEAGADKDRPFVRTVICTCVGAAVSYVFRVPLVWAPLVVFVAGFLGWLGMKWARHVDF